MGRFRVGGLISEYLTPHVIHVIELLISLALLAVLVAVAAVVIRKIRPKPIQQEPMAGDLLLKYREMHSRGELSDTEFRTIKTKLGEQLRDELRDEGETGYDA